MSWEACLCTAWAQLHFQPSLNLAVARSEQVSETPSPVNVSTHPQLRASLCTGGGSCSLRSSLRSVKVHHHDLQRRAAATAADMTGASWASGY